MAIIHHADLTPGKVELLADWLPRQSWWPGAGNPELERVAAYRFDDPAGEVGVETIIVRADDDLLVQTPLTYRASPLAGAEKALVGVMQHSVLGTRYVYDATADPVYVSELARAILTGGTEVEQFYQTDSGVEAKADDTHVRGSGAPGAEVPEISSVRADPGTTTMIDADGLRLAVFRVLVAAADDTADHDTAADNTAADNDTGETLTGVWVGQQTPVLLATAVLG